MSGKSVFKTKWMICLALVFLQGCQSTEDEVSVRSENIDFSSKPSAVVFSHNPHGENPVNDVKRTGIKPVLLHIPAIGVEAAVQHLGTAEDGTMAVPDNIKDVSWFEPGYRPGQNGRAVIAGHVDGVDGPAVFWDLSKLKQGDKIIVEGELEKFTFQVHAMESVPLNTTNVSVIFGYTASPELVLITCSGTYSHFFGTREERLIVYANYIDEK